MPPALRVVIALLVMTIVVAWSGAPRDAYAWGGVGLTLWSASRRPLALRDNPALVLLLLFVAWTLLGTLWAPEPARAFRDWVKLATLAAFAWSTAQLMATRDDGTHVAYVLRCLCVALTVVYLVEVAVWLRTVGREWHFGDRVMDPFSFQHINTFAGMIVASFALGWLVLRSDWAFRRTIVAIQLATGIVLLWLFASRTAQVSLVALVTVALLAQRRPLMRWLAVAALVAAAVAGPVVNPRFRDATMWTLHNRVQLWRGTVELISARPLFGYGWGDKTFQPIHAAHDPNRPEDWPHAHNLALQVAFGAGVIGLGLYVATFWFALAPLWRARRSADPVRARLARVLLLSAAGVGIFSLADVPRGPLHLYLWTWWAAGVALTGTRRPPAGLDQVSSSSRGTPSERRAPRPAASIAR